MATFPTLAITLGLLLTVSLGKNYFIALWH